MVDKVVTSRLLNEQGKAASVAAQSISVTSAAEVEKLMEMAMSFQQNPKSAQDLHQAVFLYHKAALLCATEPLLTARVQARMGTALTAIPHEGPEYLMQAHIAFESSKKALSQMFRMNKSMAKTSYGFPVSPVRKP
ncbi:MAG: hypothetical protein NPIRA04_32800 [Nitrospirales bacterium]|nr:MAG: hypothetical protein NPIRA04_32800 [Nitrospirales bacterium]